MQGLKPVVTLTKLSAIPFIKAIAKPPTLTC